MPTAKNATYKLKQQWAVEARKPLWLATSGDLRAYQKEHGISALVMAKRVEAELRRKA